MSTETRDYYGELEVATHACQEVIAAAHKALSKMHHPDIHHGSLEATRRMQRINDAYDTLRDPILRNEYDRSRSIGSAGRGDDPSSQAGRGLVCPRCFKVFKKPGGLAWHEQNNRNCS